MRLSLTLRPLNLTRAACSIPLNYHYYLSSIVYNWIEQSSPAYSEFLHKSGFSPDGLVRRFKHFCFSQLMVAYREIDKEQRRLRILSPVVRWYISMPIDETLQHIVIGIFEKQEFYIDREYNRFIVERVETLPEPQWERRMKFRMLSPVSVSVPEERNGRLMAHYLRADDPRLSEALRKNIINKYRSIYNGELHDTEFNCELDEEYIAARGGPERISKLITIKEGKSDETKIRGFLCPLTIEGNPDLIKLAYESGLGEKNSLGFGMIEVVGRNGRVNV
ncbi:MAG: CRISPR-associated endoribonuclease Cas6 [Bacteroidota bacterium]